MIFEAKILKTYCSSTVPEVIRNQLYRRELDSIYKYSELDLQPNELTFARYDFIACDSGVWIADINEETRAAKYSFVEFTNPNEIKHAHQGGLFDGSFVDGKYLVWSKADSLYSRNTETDALFSVHECFQRICSNDDGVIAFKTGKKKELVGFDLELKEKWRIPIEGELFDTGLFKPFAYNNLAIVNTGVDCKAADKGVRKDFKIQAFQFDNGEAEWEYTLPRPELDSGEIDESSVRVSLSNGYICAARYSDVFVINARTGTLVKTISTDFAPREENTFGDTYAIASEEHVLVASKINRMVKMFEISTGNCLHEIDLTQYKNKYSVSDYIPDWNLARPIVHENCFYMNLRYFFPMWGLLAVKSNGVDEGSKFLNKDEFHIQFEEEQEGFSIIVENKSSEWNSSFRDCLCAAFETVLYHSSILGNSPKAERKDFNGKAFIKISSELYKKHSDTIDYYVNTFQEEFEYDEVEARSPINSNLSSIKVLVE